MTQIPMLQGRVAPRIPRARTVLSGLTLLCSAAASGQEAAPTEPEEPAPYGTVIRSGGAAEPKAVEGRATQRVTKRQIEEAQPRSTPDALTGAAGVYVQKTGHAQASPYIRGMTGRRTLLLFDGLRLNHALFRQGPNQYLFTVDAGSIEALEVVRGSAGVELGANAMGGAVLVRPLEPTIDPAVEGLAFRPSLTYRHRSADGEHGGRVRLDAQIGPATGILLGAGYRTVDRLESAGDPGGVTDASAFGAIAAEKGVPRTEADGRTQLGTGFEELTADARVVRELDGGHRLTAAGYLYRQFDAPRTDRCPPPEAPDSWCLVYEEQHRTHAYAKAELRPELAGSERLDLAAGYQRQHERRRDRQVNVEGGRDDIDVLSALVRGQSRAIGLGEDTALTLLYGADGSHETVSSASWRILERTGITLLGTRGQYIDGSRFDRGGAWASSRLYLGELLTLRLGGRVAVAHADSPGDAESRSAPVDRSFGAFVGSAGAEVRPSAETALFLNVEQGFRPPNLDDLTARQSTGQGRQVENPDLGPERSLTVEVGARWRSRRVLLEAWAHQASLNELMERKRIDCDPEAPNFRSCEADRSTPFQLINLGGRSTIRGAEVEGRWRPGLGFETRAVVSYAFGEGPSPIEAEAGRPRPLSRIPPLNGVVELGWRHRPWRLHVAAVTRWAAAQDRLSHGDTIDTRIPFGGTPGYIVHDARASVAWDWGSLNLTVENLTDEPHRVHGSAVLGPARGLLLTLEVRT